MAAVASSFAVVALGTYEHALYVVGAYASPPGVEGEESSSSSSSSIRVGTLAAYVPHSAPVTCLASRGTLLASGGADEAVIVYDLASMVEEGRLEHHTGALSALALDATGAHMLSAGEDAQLCIWRTRDWELSRPIQKTHTGRRGIGAMALHPSGKAALTLGASDGLLRLWDLVKARPTVASEERGASAVAWDRGGRRYFLARGKQLVVRDTAVSGAAAERICECAAEISALEPLCAGAVACGCADGSVVVWSAADGTRMAELAGHSARVKALCFLPPKDADGALHMPQGMLASASTDGRLTLWDAASWEAAHVVETGCRVTCAACTAIHGSLPEFAPTATGVDAPEEEEEEEDQEEEEEPSAKRIKQEPEEEGDDDSGDEQEEEQEQEEDEEEEEEEEDEEEEESN